MPNDLKLFELMCDQLLVFLQVLLDPDISLQILVFKLFFCARI